MTARPRRLVARSAHAPFPRWHRRSSGRARRDRATAHQQTSALTLVDVGVLGVEHGIHGMLRRAAEARARRAATTASTDA